MTDHEARGRAAELGSADLQLDLGIRGERELGQFNERIIGAMHPMQ